MYDLMYRDFCFTGVFVCILNSLSFYFFSRESKYKFLVERILRCGSRVFFKLINRTHVSFILFVLLWLTHYKSPFLNFFFKW